MIKGVFKVSELIHALTATPYDEDVAVMLFTQRDVDRWNSSGEEVPMDLGSFVDAMSEGSSLWIDEDYNQEDVQHILEWVSPNWIGPVKYTVTEYCSLFYVIAFGADGHGHIGFESEHEEDCAEYIREQTKGKRSPPYSSQ